MDTITTTATIAGGDDTNPAGMFLCTRSAFSSVASMIKHSVDVL